jgi:hypothetical protein
LNQKAVNVLILLSIVHRFVEIQEINMIERAHEAWLYQLSLQIEAIELYVAAIPGANAVDVSKVKAALESDHNTAHGDVVSQAAVARWVDTASKRIHNLSVGQSAPDFE